MSQTKEHSFSQRRIKLTLVGWEVGLDTSVGVLEGWEVGLLDGFDVGLAEGEAVGPIEG